MTTLSALSTSPATLSPTPTPVTSRVASAGSAASTTNAAAGTTVTLSQANTGLDAQLYSLNQLAAPPVWEQKSNDQISSQMTTNFSSPSLGIRFKGLGAAMLSSFNIPGSGNYSQSVFQSPPGVKPNSDLDTSTQALLHKQTDNDIKLSIKMAGGAEVELRLGSQDNGMAVSVNVTSGTLTDLDRDALEGLANGFQSAIDGLAANPPKLDLSGLTKFDASIMSSVDLHASINNNSSDGQTIDFHADAKQRTVAVNGAAGAMKVNVDLNNPSIVGNAKQQAQAIASYLKQFDAARTRGNGDASLMTMFKDAFSEMNSNYGATTSSQQAGLSRPITLDQSDHSLLSGLADFSASISQRSQASNPMRHGENDGFDYQVSQASTLKGTGQLDRSVSQQQKSNLSAAYHESLVPGVPLRLTTDRNSQNYLYHQINDNAQSTVDIGYNKGVLTKASLNQTAHQSSRVSKYITGNLISDVTTPSDSTVSKDLLSLMKSAQSQGSRNEMDALRWQKTLDTLHGLTLLQADPEQLRSRQNSL